MEKFWTTDGNVLGEAIWIQVLQILAAESGVISYNRMFSHKMIKNHHNKSQNRPKTLGCSISSCMQ